MYKERLDVANASRRETPVAAACCARCRRASRPANSTVRDQRTVRLASCRNLSVLKASRWCTRHHIMADSGRDVARYRARGASGDLPDIEEPRPAGSGQRLHLVSPWHPAAGSAHILLQSVSANSTALNWYPVWTRVRFCRNQHCHYPDVGGHSRAGLHEAAYMARSFAVDCCLLPRGRKKPDRHWE